MQCPAPRVGIWSRRVPVPPLVFLALTIAHRGIVLNGITLVHARCSCVLCVCPVKSRNFVICAYALDVNRLQYSNVTECFLLYSRAPRGLQGSGGVFACMSGLLGFYLNGDWCQTLVSS